MKSLELTLGILIGILIGFMIGFVVGEYVTIKAVAKIAMGFVDETLIRQAIYQFQNNIGNCFPSNFTI